MLVLSRKLGETIMIGDDITIKIADIHGKQIRIGINTPRNLRINRGEIHQKTLEINHYYFNKKLPTDTSNMAPGEMLDIVFPMGITGIAETRFKLIFSSFKISGYLICWLESIDTDVDDGSGLVFKVPLIAITNTNLISQSTKSSAFHRRLVETSAEECSVFSMVHLTDEVVNLQSPILIGASLTGSDPTKAIQITPTADSQVDSKFKLIA